MGFGALETTCLCKKNIVVFLTWKQRLNSFKSIEFQNPGSNPGIGTGFVSVPTDFLDLGSRQAVDIILHRLTKAGTIRRLTRGLYDYPRAHPEVGLLAPPIEAITKALAGKNKLRLQPTGAYAANLLHLSEQVPAEDRLFNRREQPDLPNHQPDYPVEADDPPEYVSRRSYQWISDPGFTLFGKEPRHERPDCYSAESALSF